LLYVVNLYLSITPSVGDVAWCRAILWTRSVDTPARYHAPKQPPAPKDLYSREFAAPTEHSDSAVGSEIAPEPTGHSLPFTYMFFGGPGDSVLSDASSTRCRAL